MSLTYADNVIQEASGSSSAAGTSIVPTLGAGTAAGNTVIVAISGFVLGITLPTGFTAGPTVNAAGQGIGVWYKSNVSAGETSWTFTATSNNYAWYVREMSNLDPASPLDVSATNATTTGLANGATKSTGTTGSAAGLTTMQLGVWGTDLTGAGLTLGTWDTYTNGLTERADLTSTATSGSGVYNFGLAVADGYTDGTAGTFESTAKYTAASTSTDSYALMAVFRAADSPIVTPLQYHTGFEFGTHNGIVGGSISTPALAGSVVGTLGTNVIVQAGSARNGSYGLRVVQSASTAYLSIGAGSAATAQLPANPTALVDGFSVRPVSGTGVVVLAEMTPAVGTTLQVVWDSSATKIGLRWGAGGTAAYQAGTTAANTWAWVTLRASGLGTATWHAEFQVEESGVLTAQTGPSDLTGQTASVLAFVRLGGNLSQTMTADYDDWCATTQYPTYPLGVHKVVLLTPDPAATPTSTATTIGDFALLTNNATGAALTSGTLTTARDNISEVPPLISASSSGLMQATVDTGYIEFPMQTYTCTSSQVVAGVRLVACMISTTGAGAGNVGIFGYDGTAEATLVGTGFTWTPGSSTTVSSTVPPWVTAQWNPSNGWTQAKLDAAALRFGKSTDATPDMGVHAMYLEAAIGPVKTVRSLDVEGGVFAVDKSYNPNSAAPVSFLVTVPADRGATFAYTLLGTPTSTYVAAGSAPQTLAVSAAAFSDVSDTQLLPDALP